MDGSGTGREGGRERERERERDMIKRQDRLCSRLWFLTNCFWMPMNGLSLGLFLSFSFLFFFFSFWVFPNKPIGWASSTLEKTLQLQDRTCSWKTVIAYNIVVPLPRQATRQFWQRRGVMQSKKYNYIGLTKENRTNRRQEEHSKQQNCQQSRLCVEFLQAERWLQLHSQEAYKSRTKSSMNNHGCSQVPFPKQ